MKFICFTKNRCLTYLQFLLRLTEETESFVVVVQSFLERTGQSAGPLCPHWGPRSGPESPVGPSRHSRPLCGGVAGQQGHALLVDWASRGSREVLATLIGGSFQYIRKTNNIKIRVQSLWCVLSIYLEQNRILNTLRFT